MGFPATGVESIYRNTRRTILRFFNTYHYKKVKVELISNFVDLQSLCREAQNLQPSGYLVRLQNGRLSLR